MVLYVYERFRHMVVAGKNTGGYLCTLQYKIDTVHNRIEGIKCYVIPCVIVGREDTKGKVNLSMK